MFMACSCDCIASCSVVILRSGVFAASRRMLAWYQSSFEARRRGSHLQR
jgi:hypothetical protein